MEYSPSIYYEKKEAFTNYLVNHFNIHLIKSDGIIKKINAEAVMKLMGIKEHTDFYLTQK